MAVLAVATAALLVAAGPAPVGHPAGHPARHGGYVQQDTDAVTGTGGGAVGVQVEVRDRDRRARARAGVAELGGGRPVPWRSAVRIGSATKAFTATVVLQLVGAGRLSLDDTVERWLPGVVTGNGNDGRAITVRHLLQNTSGLPQTFDLPGWRSAEEFAAHRFDAHTPAYVVKLAMRHAPSSAPGTRWEYSNTNWVLAGMVVEAVTGRTWDAEVTSRVIVPLGLTGTFVPGHNPYLPQPHPRTYHRFSQGDVWHDTTVLDVKDMDAEGSLVSTTRDLERFLTALVGGELLRPAELAQMTRTVPVPEFEQWGMRYGLGLMWFELSCGGGYWTHWGDTLGASTRGGVTPDGRRAVTVSTSGNADHLKLPLEERALHPLVDHALCRGLA